MSRTFPVLAFSIATIMAGAKVSAQTLFGQVAAVGVINADCVNDPSVLPVNRKKDSLGCAEPTITSTRLNATLELTATE